MHRFGAVLHRLAHPRTTREKLDHGLAAHRGGLPGESDPRVRSGFPAVYERGWGRASISKQKRIAFFI